jgi:hypothetical protein
MPSIIALKTALEGLLWASNEQKQIKSTLHDPLCTLIRFALLPLKPEGTKLNILNHKITYRPPHSQQAYVLKMPVQDEFRWSQEEFHLLHNPIVQAVKWYAKEPLAKMIFEMAIDGIRKSLKFYEKRSKEAQLALTNFLHIIEVGLKEEKKEADIAKLSPSPSEVFLKKLWSQEEMYAIYRLLANIQRSYLELIKDKKKTKNISSLLRTQSSAIEVLLHDKEDKLARYLKSQH